MGELSGRSSNKPGIGLTRTRAMLFATLVLLLPATMAATAAAQDEPPKVDAPKSAPPPPPDLPQGLEKAPQDVQKKESAPDEKQKGAPIAPDDKEKAAPTAPAETEKPAPPAPEETPRKPGGAPPADRKADFIASEALSTRFKFVEQYGIEEDRTRPQLLTQYRVGMLETTKYETERAQGSPERNQRSRIIVYAERAAKVGKLGEPIALVRRYDKVILRDLVRPRPVNPPLLLGLTIWYHNRPPLRPQIISLSPDRPIREDEYDMIETEVSLSTLMAFFPVTAKRKSETWNIPSSAITAVSGRAPDPDDYELTGKLVNVTKSEDGNSFVAQIEVEGKFDVERKPSAFHALINFGFVPRGVAVRPGTTGEAASRTEIAEGSIRRADLSLIRVGILPEGEGRLKDRQTIELTLERRPMTLAPGEPGSPPAPLALPSLPPVPTQANSWVVFDGPDGRFHFWHPQEFRSVPQRLPTRSQFEFLEIHPRVGNTFLQILFPSKAGDQTSQQQFRDPAGLMKTLEAAWLEGKAEVTRGPKGWLDNAAWEDSKRRVYRIEAALKKHDDMKPVYADYYFIEFNQTQRLNVLSNTERADHLVVRNEVEQVIRSFQWGPSTRAAAPGAAAPEATPAPAAGASTPAAGASTPAAAENPANPTAPPLAPATAPNTPPG